MKIFTDNFKKLCLIVVFAVLCETTNATVFTALASGNFNSSLTWVGGVAPGSLLSTDAVVIPLGITVTLTSNQTFSGTSALTVNGALASTVGSALIMTSGSLAGAGTISVDSMVLGLTSGVTYTGTVTVQKMTSLGANLSSAATVTVGRVLNLPSGVLNVTAGTLTMGNLSTIILSGGTITATAGLLHLTNTYNVLYNTASATTGMELTGSGLDSITVNVPGTVTLAANQTINGVLTLTAGTLALNGQTLTFGSAGNLSSTGAGTLTGSTVSNIIVNTTAGLTGALRFASGGNILNNLTVNSGASSISSLGSDLSINGLVTLTAGILSLNGHGLTFNSTGNLASSGTGTLSGSTLSNIIVNTSGSLTGALRFAAGGNTLNNLTVNTGAAGVVTLGTDLAMSGLTTLTTGALSLNGHGLTFNSTGDFSSSGSGTITGSTLSNIIVNTTAGLTGALRFTTGGNMLNNLTINTGSSGIVNLANDLTVNGLMTLTAGTLALSGHTLTFNTLSSLAAGGTGTLTGSALSNIVVNTTAGLTGVLRFATGGSMLNNLTINTGTSSVTSLGSDLSINGLVTLTAGILSLNGHGLTFNSTGNLASSGTGTLSGSTLSNIVVNTTGSLTGALRFAAGGNMLNNLTVNTGAAGVVTLGTDLAMSGLTTLTTGALALNGHGLTFNSTGDFSSSGSGTITGSALSNIIVNTTAGLTGALRFTTGGNMLNNLTINTGSSSMVALANDLIVDGLVTLTAGTLGLNGHTLTFNTLSSLATGGTGTLTGSALSNIVVNTTAGLTGVLRFATGGSVLNNLTINTGTSSVTSLGSDLSIAGLMTLTSGILLLNGDGLIFNSAGDLSATGTGTLMGSALSNLVINTTAGLSSALHFATGGNVLNNLTINTGSSSSTMLGNDLTLAGLMTLTAGTLSLNGHTLTLGSGGNLASSGSGTLTGSALSNLVINTTGSLSGVLHFATGGNMLNNLMLNTGGNISLGSNLTIDGVLGLQSGKIMLGTNNLSIAASGMVMGGAASSYVVTDATGSLVIMNLAAGATDTFAVGTTTNFAPIAITANAGSATGDVSLTVANGVLSGGTTGVVISADQPLVNATWFVASTATSGINYNMSAMWSAAMEVNGFNRTQAYISHSTGGVWDVQTPASAGTSGSMYYMTRTGITSLSPFMVADKNAITTAVPGITANQVKLSVYPNPTTNTLYFSGSVNATTVIIYDMKGRLIKSANVVNDAVSVQELPSGTYFVRLMGQDINVAKEFIKQ